MIKAITMAVFLAGCAGAPTSAAGKPARTDVVELSYRNTVVLRGVITDSSASKVLQEVLIKDKELAKDETLYLFIDSPGGSVAAGGDLIEGINGLSRKITTITSFSASMAFITVQSLGVRLVLPNGVLMSHRAKGGVDGQIPGEMDTRYLFWKKYLEDVLKPVAGRLGMTVRQLQERHRDEWWSYGSGAVAEKTADRVVHVKCSKSLLGTKHGNVQTMFGTVDVTWSKCPLVKAPIDVDTKNVDFIKMSASDREDFNEALKELLYDRSQFLNNYILTEKYTKWFK